MEQHLFRVLAGVEAGGFVQSVEFDMAIRKLEN